MSDIAIRVEGLSKQYQIGQLHQRSDTLRDALAGLFRQNGSTPDSNQGKAFWAIRDISFDVERGEVVGIIGHNGAGKSTLLKILTRITEPTAGRAHIHGRVGSLLEVGTGFHNELTGRENIFLSGAILGMRREEITRKLDEIIDFSGVDQFIDTPVKRYSSGMKVRLGFAVAANLDPEILLIDEVLAVGDAQFQKKCLGKMGEIAGQERTVLFVSHNMTAVKSICDRAILLENGVIAAQGDVYEVVNGYLALGNTTDTWEQSWHEPDEAPGNEKMKLTRVELTPIGASAEQILDVETAFNLTFEFQSYVPGVRNISMQVKNAEGQVVFASPSPKLACGIGPIRYQCRVPGDLMNDGYYSMLLMVVEDSQAEFVLDDLLRFEIHEATRTGSWWGKRPGAVRPRLEWKTDRVESTSTIDTVPLTS